MSTSRRSFPTFITFIGFYPCVSSLMLSEEWFSVKGLPMFSILVQFRSCMSLRADGLWGLICDWRLSYINYIHMISPLCGLSNAQCGLILLLIYSIFSTLTGFLPCLCSLMHCEIWPVVECFPTFATFE